MTLPGSPSSLPRVRSEQFEGPLDLLVEEVRRQNVAVEKIAMAPIVEHFLDYMRSAADRNLNLNIEWLHMAATLIHWKSRALLASDCAVQPEGDPIRDHLVQQLLAHRGQVAEDLGRRQAVEDARFSRAADRDVWELADPVGSEEADFISVSDLIREARELADWVQQYRDNRSRGPEVFGVVADEVTVSSMVEYLRTQLPADAGKFDGVRLLRDQATPSSRACLFLGMLQMAADQELQLEQHVTFGPIWVSGAGAG